MCIRDSRRYLALCEQCEPGAPPQLRIVHVQSRRSVCVLTAALEGSFIGCMFSSDSKHILAYTGEPDHVTVVWQLSLSGRRSWAAIGTVELMTKRAGRARI